MLNFNLPFLARFEFPTIWYRRFNINSRKFKVIDYDSIESNIENQESVEYTERVNTDQRLASNLENEDEFNLAFLRPSSSKFSYF